MIRTSFIMRVRVMCLIEVLRRDSSMGLQREQVKATSKDRLSHNTLDSRKESKKVFSMGSTLDSMRAFEQVSDGSSKMQETVTLT
jgi:hypothetical protein